ncbi:hypothetical protein [Paractinoplanes toevensis]|uniref:Uncharacterized protein n=1 Tax=Paractinoplanes toevensis TaxID=571911 RepID=A0A919T677_9ACTN|nr:hypothetical protein [Actinoplanes toevensis]GIM88741.1 hypothetical protein Ato02nite_005340 [Actinoplanes toevensis]
MHAVDPAAVRFTVARVWVSAETTVRPEAMIRIGPIDGDSRWIAQRIGVRWSGCWIAADERAACLAVESWMHRRGGVAAWTELKRPADAAEGTPCSTMGA